jgi:hemerythrin superfamily protein
MTSTDAISMLKDDHKAVEQLFKRFEKAGERAHVEKRDIVDCIIESLSMHAAIEEQVFYPVVRATVPDTEGTVLESLEEHHIVKWVLSELDSGSPEDERFDAKVTVLIENVRHHIEEEEQELFPKVRQELGRNSLSDLGEAMAASKKAAPTHPHPRSADTPPGNLVAGTTAALADRMCDTVNGVAQGYVTAVGDTIATVLGRQKPRVSPSGSKVTRTTARQVRSTSSDATEAAIDAIRAAKRTGARALHTAGPTRSSAAAGANGASRAAKRGATAKGWPAKGDATGTVTSTRPSTKPVAATAKRGATTTARTAGRATTS